MGEKIAHRSEPAPDAPIDGERPDLLYLFIKYPINYEKNIEQESNNKRDYKI